MPGPSGAEHIPGCGFPSASPMVSVSSPSRAISDMIWMISLALWVSERLCMNVRMAQSCVPVLLDRFQDERVRSGVPVGVAVAFEGLHGLLQPFLDGSAGPCEEDRQSGEMSLFIMVVVPPSFMSRPVGCLTLNPPKGGS